MDQHSDADYQATQVAHVSDEKTILKRQLVRKKLETIVNPEEDIDEILSSIEQYCSLILELQ